MENKKKRSLFNVFDIVVIAIIAVLAAVLFFFRSSGGDMPQQKTTEVRYTIEFTGMYNGSEQLIKAGDKLIDKVKKFNIGTVESVAVSPAVLQTTDYENGRTVSSELSMQKDARVVVTAEAVESDSEILVDNGYSIKVGLPVSVKGPGYYGKGYIVGIERGENS